MTGSCLVCIASRLRMFLCFSFFIRSASSRNASGFILREGVTVKGVTVKEVKVKDVIVESTNTAALGTCKKAAAILKKDWQY